MNYEESSTWYENGAKVSIKSIQLHDNKYPVIRAITNFFFTMSTVTAKHIDLLCHVLYWIEITSL